MVTSTEVVSPSQQYEMKDSEVKPYVVEDKTLLSPGVWNDVYYDKDEIKKAMESTVFDKKTLSLFYDHYDSQALTWIGEVKNPREEDGDVIGDLHIVDENLARKLKYGAKFGVSPKVTGKDEEGRMKNFTFRNFSIVLEPAVKTAYINSEKKLLDRSKLPDSSFALIYEDENGNKVRKLPINDKAHVRNALARWNQTDMPSDVDEKKVLRKIIRKAESLGVDVSKDVYKKAGMKVKNKKEEKKMTEDKETAEDQADETSELEDKVDALQKELEEMKKAQEEAESEEEEEADAESQLKEQVSKVADLLDKDASEVLSALQAMDEEAEEDSEEDSEEEAEEVTEEEASEEEADDSEDVKALKEKIDSLEKKLNEPEKEAATLSNSEDAETTELEQLKETPATELSDEQWEPLDKGFLETLEKQNTRVTR